MTNNPTIDGVCKTCLGSGKEYDGAAHTCTACNGLDGAPAVERKEPIKLQDCELYAMPDGAAMRSPLYVEPPELAALQSTIAQLEDKLNKAIDLDFQRRETIARLEGRVQELESGRVGGIWFPRELGDGLAELIAEKARVCGGGAFDIWEEICERFGNAQPAPFAAALECELGSPPLEHLRDLLKLVVDPGTYPVAVLHNQIRATLATMAGLDATAALNGERK